MSQEIPSWLCPCPQLFYNYLTYVDHMETKHPLMPALSQDKPVYEQDLLGLTPHHKIKHAPGTPAPDVSFSNEYLQRLPDPNSYDKILDPPMKCPDCSRTFDTFNKFRRHTH
jgi:hypothetical protein